MRLETTEHLGRFYTEINFKLIFCNELSIDFFSNLRTVFLKFCKIVSSINSALDNVRPRTLAKPIVTYRHAWQNKRLSVRTGQTLLNPHNSSTLDDVSIAQW